MIFVKLYSDHLTCSMIINKLILEFHVKFFFHVKFCAFFTADLNRKLPLQNFQENLFQIDREIGENHAILVEQLII